MNEISQVVMHSLKVIFLADIDISIKGQCPDSGCGGTKWALVQALAASNITHLHYLISTYALHTIQTCLRNTVQHILGEGGMKKVIN